MCETRNAKLHKQKKFCFHMHKQNRFKSGSDWLSKGLLAWGCAVENRVYWGLAKLVRQRFLVPPYGGSSPPSPTKIMSEVPVVTKRLGEDRNVKSEITGLAIQHLSSRHKPNYSLCRRSTFCVERTLHTPQGYSAYRETRSES